MSESAEPAAASPLANAVIVLVRTQGPINLGMVARLCGNLGVGQLRLVTPECAIDCEEARKFSTHGRDLLLGAPVFTTLEDATADCQLVIGSSSRFRDGDLGSGLRPHEVPARVAARGASRYALVFGNEADGLNEAELRACQAWIRLDHWGDHDSYNLANAVGIAAYGVASAAANAPPVSPDAAADRVQIEALYRYWLGTLDRFQYFRRTDAERFAPLLRRFIGRQHLTPHDVQLLWGMFTQFHVHAFGDKGR